MKKNRVSSYLINYIKFVPKFFTGSFFAFLIDNLIYSSLRPLFGISYSACIAFLGGASILFVYLQISSVSKVSSKRKSFLILLFIGLGSLIINILMLKIIEILIFSLSSFPFEINSYYAGITKLISGCFGFLWSSFMTSKYLYKS